MIKKTKEDEAAETANASETTTEESSSEEENLEDSKKTKEKVEVESKPEEIASDYLGKPEEVKKDEVDYKKRYGDSTREYQALKTKTDRLSQAIANLERFARANPNILTEIETAREKVGQTEPGLTETLSTSGPLIQQQIDQALEPVKKVIQDVQSQNQLAKVKVLAEFEKKTPDLFPPKATRKEKAVVRQRIGKVANALVETGMDFKEAVSRAYLTVNPKAAVKKGKDEAYLERFDESQASFSSQTSSEGKKPGKPKYTKAELEVARKLDPKVYKAMKDETK